MDSIEILIPDNEGNHLVVALSFYDECIKSDTFRIPDEFAELDIADISISKLDIYKPLSLCAFHKMCQWLIEQFLIFPNAVFTFICSTDPLANNHIDLTYPKYRWRLFEHFYQRNIKRLKALGIESKDLIVGQGEYQTFARVFYRQSHAPIIHVVIDHLNNKYGG